MRAVGGWALLGLLPAAVINANPPPYSSGCHKRAAIEAQRHHRPAIIAGLIEIKAAAPVPV
jgi:hypothetical protein